MKTITKPTAAERAKQAFDWIYGKKTKAFEREDLQPEATYAVCLVRLHPSVEPSDYPALKTAIEDVAGIQNISLLMDYTAAATADLPALHVEELVIEGNVKLRDDTPVEP